MLLQHVFRPDEICPGNKTAFKTLGGNQGSEMINPFRCHSERHLLFLKETFGNIIYYKENYVNAKMLCILNLECSTQLV